MRRLLPLLFTLLAACMAETVAPPPATAAGKPLAIALDCTSPVTEGQAIPCVASKSGGNGATIKAKWTAGAQSGLLEIGKAGPVRFTVSTTDDTDVQGARALTIDLAVTSGSVRPTARATVQILDNDVAPPVVVPPVIPPVEPTIPNPGTAPIPSNFDVSSQLVSFPPAEGDGGPVGAFRFLCNPGQLLRDDPILYPGQPGRSHGHQFFGNTGANAYSTHDSLRTTGDSTCMNPLNRSGYWMPWMEDGKGHVVRPNYVNIYYKQPPPSSIECTPARGVKACVDLPPGLRYIFGRDMLDLAAPKTGYTAFLCVPTGFKSDNMETALKGCPIGESFEVQIGSPPCWNGKDLDSPDHRSHVAYVVGTPYGYATCPSTHPYLLPTFSLIAIFEIGADDDTSLWSFSSDVMAPNEPHGSTFHADWFGAWDPTAQAMWQDNCLRKSLSCKAGDLGNGKGLKMYSGFSWKAVPRLVPIP